MAMLEIQWRPDRKTLAEFSEVWLFAVGMVAAPLAWYRGHAVLGAACWTLAVAVRLAGWLRPAWVRPVYVGLMVAGWPIGWLASHLTLAAVYYLVLSPIGLLFRLLGRDPMHRAFEKSAKTYWEPHDPNRGLDRYLRQF